MATATRNAASAKAEAEANVEETEQQQKNRLRNEAEREVLNAHRDELNTITEQKFRENNLPYTRRLTEREKAAKKIDELLNQHPELRVKYVSAEDQAAKEQEFEQWLAARGGNPEA